MIDDNEADNSKKNNPLVSTDVFTLRSRKYGIQENNYYNWSKDFMEAGKKRLSGDTEREANTSDVKELKVQM